MATKTPVTMLSGFLGAGKTTLLRYVLENSKEKIACIVNDVASVNIDAKLIRNDKNKARDDSNKSSTADLADTIELANGCACCSIQDELFASFEQIVALGDKNGAPYARIILENSGVAEPQAIRDKFNEAQAAGHPLMDRISLDTLVTLVDCGTFLKEYASKQPLVARPDLGDGGNLRPVVDLLVEQIECADFVALNKIDTLDAEQLDQLSAIVAALNPLATVIRCQNGQIDIEQVFGRNVHSVVAQLNIEGQHRGAVAAAKAAAALRASRANADQHDHDHDHEHHHEIDGHKHDDCDACGHDHSHEHEHDHHDHDGHSHEHGHEHHDHAGCEVCTHEHHHEHHHHDHEADGRAHDGCKACDHDHGHDHAHHHHRHEHKRQETTAAERFGIRSFVYSRRRPFHPQSNPVRSTVPLQTDSVVWLRLKELVLKWLPVATNAALDGGEAPAEGDNPVKKVLRSKGFMWMSNSHTTAYYWSHAGSHFEIRDEGDWWASVPDSDWPEDAATREVILQDVDKSSCFGDRRQEIVFIGVAMEEDKICAQLDAALLMESEMEVYKAKYADSPDPPHAIPEPAAQH